MDSFVMVPRRPRAQGRLSSSAASVAAERGQGGLILTLPPPSAGGGSVILSFREGLSRPERNLVAVSQSDQESLTESSDLKPQRSFWSRIESSPGNQTASHCQDPLMRVSVEKTPAEPQPQ